MADVLHVRVNSPAKVVWEGEALSVSSENTKGPFDILPMHANFLSFVENKQIVIRTQKGKESYSFTHSVIFAKDNKVYIYTNF